MPTGMIREMTKEDEAWIKDNLRYDPQTGLLWWTKLGTSSGPRRDLNYPAGRNKDGYLMIDLNTNNIKSTTRLHRVAWFLHYDVWPKKYLDHINNVRDDNRIVNLREATSFENQGNQKVREGGSSRYKGVSWNKKSCKWVAQIRKNSKVIHLGYYHNEEEAALTYNKAALEYFGEYAKINEITP